MTKRTTSSIGKFVLLLVVLLALSVSGYILWKKFSAPTVAEFLKGIEKKKFNVVLITIDTLRADRLHCYGFDAIRTPNIDALAARGILFANATAHVPLPLPAHTSIMTGMEKLFGRN